MIFPDFHNGFIAYLREFLNPGLPQPYYASIGSREWVEITERYIGPDVSVMLDRRNSDHQQGALAVAEPEVTLPIVIHVPHDERIETNLEICTGRGSERRVVTIIEILSPSNKTNGEQGRSLYLQKQQEVLQSKTHLLEIDLLARDCIPQLYRANDYSVKSVNSTTTYLSPIRQVSGFFCLSIQHHAATADNSRAAAWVMAMFDWICRQCFVVLTKQARITRVRSTIKKMSLNHPWPKPIFRL